MTSALSVDRLSFAYGPVRALDDISFELPQGAFVGLLGPNGAGKTTLFALLTRLLAPQAGQIEIFGQGLHKRPGLALRQMGVVFQQSTLDMDLTIAQNLHYHAALHGMPRSRAQQSIDEQLQRFDMTKRAADKVRTLNQGHRRRVEFARALLHHPQLLLLDEATVGLDVETRHMINQHVRGLCRDHSVTVLWASHLIDDIREQDRILLLRSGELLDQGLCADVLRQRGADNLRQLMLDLGSGQAA